MTEHNLAVNQTESNLYALSFNQKAMWFHYRYAPMSTAYNVNVAGRTRSEINIPALKRALQELTNRHLILRTSFINLNGELMQEICNHGETFICEIDASSWSDEFLNEQVLHEAHRPLNLIQEPLLQVFLFTQRNSSILLLKSHHMITDFLSFSYFLHELGILYTSEVQQMQGILEPVRKQYTDFVHWQANMLINKEGISHRTYWEQQLSHKIPVLNLPINRRDITHLTNHGAAYAYKFDEGLIRKLKTLAQKEETTLYKVLLAAFLVLLYHYTTQEDILIGTFV